MDVIIRNGTVVSTAGLSQTDIGIKDGRIFQIGGRFPAAAREIEARGCFVMPGGIDVHTHLDAGDEEFRSADDFRSGTLAAACGGTTTVIDFCPQRSGQSLSDAIARWDGKAVGQAAVDYGYHMIVTEMTDGVFAELATLPDRGIPSFKLFMAYRGDVMTDDVVLLKALEQAKKHGALVMVHAENGDAADYLRDRFVEDGKTSPLYHALSRLPRIEAEATARAIALAEIVGTSIYIVHLTCAEALDEFLRAKRRGVDAIAETCTQYLYFTKDDLDRPDFEGAKFVFTPPARIDLMALRLTRGLSGAEVARRLGVTPQAYAGFGKGLPRRKLSLGRFREILDILGCEIDIRGPTTKAGIVKAPAQASAWECPSTIRRCRAISTRTRPWRLGAGPTISPIRFLHRP